jgi:hypothetical protein
LALVSWSGFLWKLPSDWFLLGGIGIVFYCLVRLYRALGDDDVLPEPVRSRLRRHILMGGPVGALETLLVCYPGSKFWVLAVVFLWAAWLAVKLFYKP